jgi:ACS family glucarate transporter-like MFS transporter
LNSRHFADREFLRQKQPGKETFAMTAAVSDPVTAIGRVRFSIVAMLFAVTIVNYADRATIAIAGPVLSKDLGLSAVQMGFVFSAFGWSYVIGQIPGGWLLDRFGSKSVYFVSIFTWSLFTLLQGAVGLFAATSAVYALFALRFLVGFAESPSFPANARIVAAWFPANERGTASAIFNSAQYFATVLFAPIMGWITVSLGWPYVFYFMGLIGVLVSAIWLKVLYAPNQHPRIGRAELDYIERGGALVNMDAVKGQEAAPSPGAQQPFKWDYLRQLVSNRMMLGIYLGQYCINTLTFFFITWFPVYLVQQRGMSILNAGMVASIPAICGAQDADRGGNAAVDQHGDLQLRRCAVAGRVDHCVCVLWQRRRRARMGCHLGYLSEGNRGIERRAVQYVWKHFLDHDADYHRLHHSGHRLI